MQEAVFRRGEPFRICRKASGRGRAAHAPPEAPFEGRPVPRSEGIAVKYNYYSFIVVLPFHPFSSENIPDTGAKEPPPAPVSRRAETGRKTAVFPSMGGPPSHENRKNLISPCNLQGKPYHMYNNSNLPNGQNAHAIRNEKFFQSPLEFLIPPSQSDFLFVPKFPNIPKFEPNVRNLLFFLAFFPSLRYDNKK